MAAVGLEAFLTARAILYPDMLPLKDEQLKIVQRAELLVLHAIEDHIRQTWECAEAIVREDGLTNDGLIEKFLSRAEFSKRRSKEALEKAAQKAD